VSDGGRAARRPGRPPGPGNSRERVLAAAREVFAERGYDRASLRAIAARADVDPGMVRHFFGDKEGLFRAALELPFNPAEMIPLLLAPGLDGLGERVVRFFCGLWEGERGPAPFVAVLRGATSHEQSAAMLREFVTRALVGRVAAALDRPQPALRATLAASQLVGLGLARYVVRIEPLASVPVSTVVAAVGPTVQWYLTGDLPLPDDPDAPGPPAGST
jgi:AcrR family transcriptional regulator